MATKLQDLSDQAIGLIFDLLDSRSLFRSLIVGNSVLSNKVKCSVRRFTHDTGYLARFAKWPNFSGFLALEHVSVSSKDPTKYYEATMMHGVDLLTLPSTLRTLELFFRNDLLCLVTLPPVTYSHGGPFTPRLRQDIKDHFKHLERLTWMQNEVAWDMSQFAEDLIRWPLNSWTPLTPIPLSRASKLPSTALCLNVQLPNGTIDLEEQKLPSSLQQLRISTPVDRSLTVAMSGLSILSGLFQLTSLSFSPTAIDTKLLLALPRTLVTLNLESYPDLELESLAYFPPELTSLTIDYDTLHSSTTRRICRRFPGTTESLPTSFLPSMRTTVVEKLPAKLKCIPQSIWELIRPEDWDAFPSKNATTSSDFRLTLAPCHIPYIPHLPLRIQHVTVPLNCTTELAASLPRTLTELELHLLETPSLTNQAILETLSHRIWMLRKLTLYVDQTFEFDPLYHLTAPCLRDLTVTSIGYQPIPILAHNAKIPSCFGTLHRLGLGRWSFRALTCVFQRVLEACSELKELIVESEGTNCEPFLEEWVPFLPPKLERLSVPMDRVYASTFARLPRSLNILYIYVVPGHVANWKLKDLAQLPKRISSVCIPYHNIGEVQEDEIRANLNEVAANLLSDPDFVLCADKTGEFLDYVIVSRPPGRPSLVNMLEVERLSRIVLPTMNCLLQGEG